MDSTHLPSSTYGGGPAFPFFLVPLLVLACFGGSWLAWQANADFLVEEGPGEWVQAAVLLAGAVAHGARSRWGRAAGPGMLLRAGLAMLCLTFCLREVDIDDLGDPAVWKPIERAVRAVALFFWAVLLVAAVRRLRRRPPFTRALLAELFARPWALHALVLLAGLFLIASWPFDKALVPIDAALSLYFEETLELCGYALLLAAHWVRPAAPNAVPL